MPAVLPISYCPYAKTFRFNKTNNIFSLILNDVYCHPFVIKSNIIFIALVSIAILLRPDSLTILKITNQLTKRPIHHKEQILAELPTQSLFETKPLPAVCQININNATTKKSGF